LYQFLFVRPVLRISGWVAACDKNVIDWAADHLALAVTACARLDNWIDRIFVDRLIDLMAGGIYAAGLWLRRIQTGNLRQYIMLLALGLIALFVVLNLYQNF
jgi:NADH:ubiquinone oxidoreductase subunit 5 (subunit L)/multisubunit Na+/H+ antiporter MnhA subunit